MSRWRTLFFWINFPIAIGMMGLSIWLAIANYLRGDYVGGMWFCCGWLLCALAFGVALGEWRLFVHRDRGMEPGLGVLMIALAGLAGLVLYRLISSCLNHPADTTAILTAVVAGVGFFYCLWCGFLRILRRTSRPESRGFAVEPIDPS